MTQQDRQIKKVKLFRVLKVVFYSLGFPLFFVAVFLASVRFIGSDPFKGNTAFSSQLGFFNDINITLTSPALYGIWIALGIWIFVAIVHIILAKTVKNRRVRTLSVTALSLVVMLAAMFGMDGAMSAKVDEIYKNAPSTVATMDYKTLLSYYRTITSSAHGKNLTESLISQVELLEKAYNVAWEGLDKSGVAGSISNKPATYYDVIGVDSEGNATVGVDISFVTDKETGKAVLDYDPEDGNRFKGTDGISREVEGTRIIRLAPNSKGELVINGQVYSHYTYAARNSVTGGTLYTWYIKDMKATSWTEDGGNKQIDGIYGKGLYSNSGLLTDGWIFSLENVLEILEDYYEAQAIIGDGDAKFYAEMYEEAWERRDAYYKGIIPDADGQKADPWLQALYGQEVYLNERFSLTRGELDELIAKVGALLGDNKLFDYLFTSIDKTLEDGKLDGLVSGFLGGSFSSLFKQLNEGMPFSTFGLNAGTLKTISDILQLLTGKTYDYVDDIILTLSYKAPDCYNVQHDNLYVGLVRGVEEWHYASDDSLVPIVRVKKEITNDKNEKESVWVWKYTDSEEEFTAKYNDVDKKYYDENGLELKRVVKPGNDPEKDMMLDIDFSDEELFGPTNIFDKENGTPTYAFDFDTLSAFLNNGLNNLLNNYNISLSEGTVGTIVNLVKTLGVLKTIDVNGESYTGLVISGIEIPILNSKGQVALDINGILEGLLKNWYSYQSAVIKPVWEFYIPWEDYVDTESDTYKLQQAYMQYERALYTGSIYGSMIGSTLIGDNLGTGAYPASLGLTDLAAVQKLKTELSYQPQYFPMMAARDMIALFTGLVVLFYFISFVAAQREEDYATGKLTARNRKEEKAVKKHEAEVIAEFDAADVGKADGEGSDSTLDDASDVDELRKEQEKAGEDPDVPVNQNSDEEVL